MSGAGYLCRIFKGIGSNSCLKDANELPRKRPAPSPKVDWPGASGRADPHDSIHGAWGPRSRAASKSLPGLIVCVDPILRAIADFRSML